MLLVAEKQTAEALELSKKQSPLENREGLDRKFL
jgi:hypothetical protein